MPFTSTQIANMALAHLGNGKAIASLSERSAEAEVASRFYSMSLQQMLKAFAWPFATKFATLSLVEEDPNDEWAYSYRYPSDCLEVRRILSGVRQDNRQSRIPYKIGQDSQGYLIFTDQSEAELEYTVNVEDESYLDVTFVTAFSYLLAFYMAPTIAGFESGLQAEMGKLYQFHIAQAQALAANEEQPDQPIESEFIRAREGVSQDPFNTFFDPVVS